MLKIGFLITSKSQTEKPGGAFEGNLPKRFPDVILNEGVICLKVLVVKTL